MSDESTAPSVNEPADADAVLDLEVSAEVWLGSEKVDLSELVDLQPGGVLPLSHDPDGPVDLVVNGSVMATGELVVVDGHFGFRVASTSRSRIERLEQEHREEEPQS